jgi:hypothetical protein
LLAVPVSSATASWWSLTTASASMMVDSVVIPGSVATSSA